VVRSLEIARAVGRGARSAIGVHGFFHGGLIVDAGKRTADELGALAARVEVPHQWRILLLCPRGATGLCGREEREAFESLPAVPKATTEELCRLALLDIVPAAREGDFATFASALHRFGVLAGTCFAPRQFGSYSSHWAAETVALLTRWGVPCVVQSSWGPTLAAFFPDAEAAIETGGRLASGLESASLEFQLARAKLDGASAIRKDR
jgi:beta-RFAP synthase